ncbi:MAG: 16S rRNA (cytosine(1402)-N(4))-methyltransferase RsmH [Candidatus Rokubacteria bacterium]|nr:16S rRNA (cytosine(1402)-N(4))-methyltransferase RsmH [Candidatus Rokubacteria bacterium]MBI2554456.1 16S rRNA (cytosine(1402)-N(4))-methyltransferase RsmH [Candidatus Rokubacteria bacterium]
MHLPVLPDEVTFLLRPRTRGWVVDGTVGMGGHAALLLERGGDQVRLLGIDRDPEALALARRRLAPFGARVILQHASFRHLAAAARENGVEEAHSVLLDLGLSSQQLAAPERGFSFLTDAPLDMRFDRSGGRTAAQVLARLSEAEIERIIREYGDEPHARRIAREIVARRRRTPLRTTLDLVAAVKAAIPRRRWPRDRHVATRTFQAVRMAVNEEIETLTEALPRAAGLLAPGGRLGVISFHSGEDRVVKRAFRALAKERYAVVEPSPITPCREEMLANPRCRSAKLRVLERIGDPHGAR